MKISTTSDRWHRSGSGNIATLHLSTLYLRYSTTWSLLNIFLQKLMSAQHSSLCDFEYFPLFKSLMVSLSAPHLFHKC